MNYSQIGFYFLTLVSGYLFGSILFAWIITKIVTGKDIRTIGNRNPGARNVLENVGFFWGAMVGVLDILKVLGPLLIAHYKFHLDTIFLFSIAAGAILGHLYPLYFNFRGGKGAAIMVGSYLFFAPYLIVGAGTIVLLVSFLTKFLSRFVSWIKPVPISAALTIIVATIGILFLKYSIGIKLGIVTLVLISSLNKETRQDVIEFVAKIKK